jgi:Rieske Fe-S protein
MKDPTLSRRRLCVLAGAGLLPLGAATGCGSTGPDHGSTEFAAGSPSQIEVGQAMYFADEHTYVCRDAAGYYALWDDCKHAHCFVQFRAGNDDFLCPCHQSRYAFDGSVAAGPTVFPLDHFALRYDRPTDNLVVDRGSKVAAGTRLAL